MSNESERLTEVIGMLKARADADKLSDAVDLLYSLKASRDKDAKRYADSQKLQDIGRSTFESIAEMVAALECDYDRLEELRREKSVFAEDHDPQYRWEDSDEAAELAELEEAAGDCESREDAERRISEDPLSIELEGKWSLGEEPTADKAYILLGTGGPATRIVCELDDNMEPHRAWIQAQDWFLPWTDYVGGDSDTLLTYCRCFYFGEG